MKWKKLLSREGVDLTTISGIDIVFYEHIKEFTGENKELFFTVLDKKVLTHYIGVDSLGLGRYLYKKFFNSPQQIKNYYNEGKLLKGEIKSLSEKAKKQLRGNSKEMLNAFYDFKEQFMIINYIFSITSWLAIEAWQHDFEKLGIKDQRALDAICTPWKKTALHEIQEKLRKNVNVSKLVDEYQFLRNWSVVWYREIDEEWVKSLGVVDKKKKKLKLEDIKKQLKLSDEENHFLDMAKYVLFFKDWRDDLRRFHTYSWVFLFEKFAKKFSIQYDDVGYLTLDEIEECLKKEELDIDLVIKRKNSGFVVTVDENMKIKVLDGVPKKYVKIINDIDESELGLSIKGLVAFTGKVAGKVVLVNSYHDLKKVKEGDVLVANTTHPTFLPAMQKAAAFVTNEGGIASHAAIVAREMKKPCIVGTKNATKLLFDNDEVVVDAENGIVRKLK